MEFINENIKEIRENLAVAAKKIGKDPESITLVAVSKTYPSSYIDRALKAGIKDIAENRVQELESKYELLIGKKEQINWHLIGHLQSNKVKHVIDKACLIHSVDSLKLCKEIDKRAKQMGLVANILIEINIADEESKNGVQKTEIFDILAALAEFENLCCKGIMCIAPYVLDADLNRPHFKEMNGIFQAAKNMKLSHLDMKFLSMGMSNDYIVAIEEGANIVRIGSKIFGARV